MDYLIDFIRDWGYVAVFLGSLIEGESVILTASFLAHQGYLDLSKIMLVAFIGTLVADQTLYFVGRHYGPKLFQRHPKLLPASNRAFDLLHKWDVWFILTFRFIYGVRIISPIVVGASGLAPRRFAPLNFIAAIIWTILSCSAGYLIGEMIEDIFENFHIIEKYFLYVSLALIAAIGLCVYVIRRIRHKKGPSN